MQGILNKLLEDITYAEKSDEKPDDFIKCLRQEAAKWACVFGDINCKLTAASKLSRHLNNNERLLPGWKKWAYCNGVVNIFAWLSVFGSRVNTTDNNFYEYLPCATSNSTVNSYLTSIVNRSRNCVWNSSIDGVSVQMQTRDCVNSFLLAIAKNAKVFTKDMSHIVMEKRPREINRYAVIINIINHLHSENELDKVFAFIKKYSWYLKMPKKIEFKFQHKLNRQGNRKK